MKLKAPGLRVNRLRNGTTVIYWRARKPATAMGFTVKTARLWSGVGDPAEDEAAKIIDRCLALSREQKDWMAGKRTGSPSVAMKKKGLVYFAKSGGKVKIGFTTNLGRRMSSLRTGAPVPIEIIGTIKCSADREALLHRTFGRYREHGEWFRLEGDLADYVATMFDPRRTAPAHTAHKLTLSD